MHRAWQATQRMKGWLVAGLALLAAGCGDERQPLVEWWATAGAAGSTASAGGGDSVGSGGAPSPFVGGGWAILATEMDGTVVDLDVTGNGKGCQAGWPEPNGYQEYLDNFCGPVTGSLNGDHIVFDLALTGFHGLSPLHYGFEGTVAAHGTRMAGLHHIISSSPPPNDLTEPGAVLRFERDDPRGFPFGEPWPEAALHAWRSAPLLVGTEVQRGPFVAGHRYRLAEGWHGITGDLGEFFRSELSFDTSLADTITVHAGPVPKTLDDRPVRLAIRFSNERLADVEVEMPSGETFLLQP